MKGTVYTLHAHGVRQQAARGGRVRRLPVLGRFVLSLLLAFAVICQPYTLAVEGWQIKAQKQEAQAVPVAIPAALAYLEAMAAAAGLSVGDFMLTVGISVASITGFNMLEEQARYGASGTIDGLYKLVSTAEWPEWSTLDAETQESWGSEANYTAAQFNAGLSALGLAESRDAYYGGSGGGDLDEGSTSIAQRIGELANTWATGGITALSDVYAMVSDPTNLIQGVEPTSYGLRATKKTQVNGHEVRFAYIPVYRTWSNGPSDNPPIFLTPGNWYCCDLTDVVSGTSLYKNLWFIPTGTSLPGIALETGDERVTVRGYNPNSTVKVMTEKPIADRWGQLQGMMNASAVTIAGSVGDTYRVGYYDNPSWYFNAAYEGVYYDTHNVAVDISEIPYDYGQMPGTDGDMVNGLDYPEETVGATDLGPGTEWPELFGEKGQQPTPTPTPDPGYPESDFNPNAGDDGGDYVPETSTPEWQQQTQDQIFTPALNLPFDEMFPFCVIWDISKLMNKLYELGGYQAVSADQSTSLRSLYDKREGLQVQADVASKGGAQPNTRSKPGWTVGHTEFVLPVSSFGVNGMYDLEIDVWPLAVLLAWLKPFFQLAFIAGLLYVTIVTFRMFIFTD